MDHDQTTTDRIIGCAIDVHRNLGAGLLESAYQTALCFELAHKGIRFEKERVVPLVYRGMRIGDYRPDLIVEDTVVVEVKSVLRFEPVFSALNFNKTVLRSGIKRIVL